MADFTSAGGQKADADPRSFNFGQTADGLPWEKWSDGGIWRVVEGADFPMSPVAFKHRLQREARARYKAVEYKDYGPEVFFRFRELPPLPPQFAQVRQQLMAAPVALNGGSGATEAD